MLRVALPVVLAIVLGACGEGEEPRVPAAPLPTTTTQARRVGGELDEQTALDEGLASSPPDLRDVAPQHVRQGERVRFTIRAVDTDSPCSQLLFQADGLPHGLRLTSFLDCSAEVEGTVSGAAGTYRVIYRVHDAANAEDAEVALMQVEPGP